MIHETSEQIHKRFLELNVDIKPHEIERRLSDLTERFKVPPAEAERSVVSYFLREHKIKREDYYGTPGGAAPMRISDIDQAEQWVNLRAKVVQLWESTSPSIDQVGLIGDETGTIKFVKWAKSELPALVEGKSYSLENMTTDEWQGRFSVKMNRTTRILELDEEIKTPDMEAHLVAIDGINESGKWINLRAKVTQLWESEHESIDQVGLIGDETGTIKFVKWAKSELPALVEGKSYSFENLVTDEFEERFSVKFGKSSQIEELDEDIETPDREAQLVAIDGINQSGQWINLRAKVVQLWESEHESIDQVGLIGDETGTIKFVKWAKSELPHIEEGKSYSFENLVTDEFEERFSVKFNKSSSINEIDEDIEVGYSTTEFTGAMVHIQDGSGLIRRCPICNRALMKGTCMEHGNVDGIHDLRIKAVMDNGVMVQEALFNREITESIGGITLDEAKEMAVDALDQSVVLDEMKRRLLGRYYTMTGSILDRYLLVESVGLIEKVSDQEVDSLLAEVT
jgi:ssDNA-binding replication factor A large subunit